MNAPSRLRYSTLIFISFHLLIACATNKPGIKRPYIPKPPTNSERITELYEWAFVDYGLEIFSAQDVDDTSYKFSGKKLDSAQLSLFPANFNFYYD